ncbi:hypothetical protein SDC9_117859 [bioreactor metagenome]|uniref:Uncharacterized protein n=1 Tax=bioreactor metagenome TaxID=1076179 RepID=A0A645C0P3_9ZZZZ|nr:hypothetical protein [Aminivibrio sp.]MEA4952727.1 hypothetical protein [Aminivibrio sp.]
MMRLGRLLNYSSAKGNYQVVEDTLKDCGYGSCEPQSDDSKILYAHAKAHFTKRVIKDRYDPESGRFSPFQFPWTEWNSGFDDLEKQEEQERFDDWCYQTSLDLWEESLDKQLPRSLSELEGLSKAVLKNKGYDTFASAQYRKIMQINRFSDIKEFIQQAKDLLDNMQTWINELKSKIQTEKKGLQERPVFLVSRSFLAAPRSSSRSRRSPVRSAAKSGGDDNGGDGDSDGPGEPPKPSHKGRAIPLAPVQARLIPLTSKTNSLPHSRTPHPCRWSLDWRWVA